MGSSMTHVASRDMALPVLPLPSAPSPPTRPLPPPRNSSPAPKRRPPQNRVTGESSNATGTEQRMVALETGIADLRGEMAALRGRFDAWDVTVSHMADYQRQMAMLAEELRKLKKATGVDSAPGDGDGPS